MCVRACACARVYVWTLEQASRASLEREREREREREKERKRERERENLRALIERIIVQMPHVLGTLSRSGFRVQMSVDRAGWCIGLQVTRRDQR